MTDLIGGSVSLVNKSASPVSGKHRLEVAD